MHLRAARDPRRRQGGGGHGAGAGRLRVPAARRASTSPTTRAPAFDGTNVALLVGARPRTKGMERADLLEANGGIFKPQGEAIAARRGGRRPRARGGQPGQHERADRPAQRGRRAGRALHRDDAARPQPRRRAARREDRRGPCPTSPTWRCGATTRRRMYPDLFNAKVRGERAWDAVGDEAWVADEYIPRVGKRGAEVLEARGASSAASAANAAIDHVRDWVLGTPGGRLGVDGRALRRLLRRRRGDHLLVPACRCADGRVGDRRRASRCRRSHASGSTGPCRSCGRSATRSSEARAGVTEVTPGGPPPGAVHRQSVSLSLTCQPRPDFTIWPSSASVGITR